MELRRQDEFGRRGDQFFFQRGRDRERLEGRTRFVVEPRRLVHQVFAADSGEVAGVDRGPVGHRQDLRVAGVDDDRRRPFRRIRFADFLQHFFGFLLDHRFEGQLDVFAVAGFLHGFQPDRVAERVLDDLAFTVGPLENRFLARLEPHQALVFRTDRADHLARHLPLRVGAAAVGKLTDPFQVEGFDLCRGGEVDFVGDVGETRFCGQRFQHFAFLLVEDRGQLGRCLRRVFQLIGSRVDRRRLFGGGELIAAAVEQAAAQTGHDDRFGLLGDGLGGELGTLHPLQPEGAADDHYEAEHEAGEEQADAAVDQTHPLGP
jgi:hypothetical protein